MSNENLNQLLKVHNYKWKLRAANFSKYSGMAHWHHGQIIDNELRRQYELYLPICELRNDLYQLAQYLLPTTEWIPCELRNFHNSLPPIPMQDHASSLADFWASLPTEQQGILTYSKKSLFALLCALADPPRFGTANHYYTKQLSILKNWFTATQKDSLRIVDIGCGVGHGLFDLIKIAKSCGVRNITATGITREKLEVWMAKYRCLPHNHSAQNKLQKYPNWKFVNFKTGELPKVIFAENYDLIVCNGLIGGRFYDSDENLQEALQLFATILANDGIVAIANKFHNGTQVVLGRFAKFARLGNWHLTGDNQCLFLRR